MCAPALLRRPRFVAPALLRCPRFFRQRFFAPALCFALRERCAPALVRGRALCFANEGEALPDSFTPASAALRSGDGGDPSSGPENNYGERFGCVAPERAAFSFYAAWLASVLSYASCLSCDEKRPARGAVAARIAETSKTLRILSTATVRATVWASVRYKPLCHRAGL